MTINHDLLLSVEDKDADGNKAGDNNDKQRRYKKSMPDEWTMHHEGKPG